ncbi:MAG TPA: hypothetical protein VGU44_04170, partial [Gammaproteobacteria bacterium]|nr:hypothetical protein [Gammaproteobacteria bacterium]
MEKKPITFLSQRATNVHPKSLDETPLLILIKMPNINHADSLLKEINTGAIDYTVFEHFSIQNEEGLITINIKNTKNTEFFNGFLIALSDTIKGYLLSDNENKEKVSFFLEGQEAAAAATCLASCGLWGEHYSFSDKAQETLFHEYHKKFIEAIAIAEKELA